MSEEKLLNGIDNLLQEHFLNLTEKLLQSMHLKFLHTEIQDSNIINVKGSIELGVISYKYAIYMIRNTSEVNDSIVTRFREGMDPHTDKGLIITTGKFTRKAKQLAKQKGKIPIDLVDGTILNKKITENAIQIE
ncbi:MAG: restriction endonuclease [Flavobacteriaceae bacterium]|uniref:restriction endonuclease n=1 Tax=Gelidibacter japonicus TaxID=1962232 RepID=UPI001D2944E6|nr:restriction endonuclease [Flavobacteriaceae bacterium]